MKLILAKTRCKTHLYSLKDNLSKTLLVDINTPLLVIFKYSNNCVVFFESNLYEAYSSVLLCLEEPELLTKSRYHITLSELIHSLQ